MIGAITDLFFEGSRKQPAAQTANNVSGWHFYPLKLSPNSLRNTGMKNIRLAPRQRNLLCELVDHKRHGRLPDLFGVVPTRGTDYVIYLRGRDSLRLARLSDLDALCEAGLLEQQWNRMSNARLYRINKATEQAVKSGIIVPEKATEGKTAVAQPDKHPPTAPRQKVDALRSTLKWRMAESMQGVELGEAVIRLTLVRDAYYQATPDTAIIARTLDELGWQLMTHFNTAVTTQEKSAASLALAAFGEWAHAIYQMLTAQPDDTQFDNSDAESSLGKNRRSGP